MISLYRKEINSFLSSLIGYIVIIVFLLVIGLFLWVFPLDSNVFYLGYANIDGLFTIAPFVFLFLIPAITMRMFSEEKKTATIEQLLTRPITDFQIIFAKFLAGLSLVVITLIPTLVYFFSVYELGFPKGNIDQGAMWGSYIGLFFLASAFVAIGLFASSITDNQIVSFILAVVISGFAYMGFEFIWSLDLFGSFDLFIRSLGISAHYSSISRGVVDTRDIIYFLSVVALFILLTKFVLGSRKWKQ